MIGKVCNFVNSFLFIVGFTCNYNFGTFFAYLFQYFIYTLFKKEGSYTTYLFNEGIDKILKKVGEESTEVIVGAKNQDVKETTYEISDLLYHVFVLMVEMGISIDDVTDELARRHVIDHKVKQKKMQ